MCGISGVAGHRNVAPLLLKAMRNLEYRGYDSCGMAIVSRGRIEVRKNAGTVEEANKSEHFDEMQGVLGIAHTRWATHGSPTKVNAHPHLSCDGTFAVVHNGIIANFEELKRKLEQQGHRFVSQTDTETIAHLIEAYYGELGNVEAAFVRALGELHGTFAVVMVTSHDPARIYCSRNESPLILGIGTEENFIGSDINAFIEQTRNTAPLNDGEYAVVSRDRYLIKNLSSGETQHRPLSRVDWNVEAAQRGGYAHYMQKEIYEQPQAIRNVLSISHEELLPIAQAIHESRNTYLAGMGTAYYVTLVGHYYLSILAGKFCAPISSDEFELLAEVGPEDLLIAPSQSGETYDTLRALRHAKAKGAKTAAIINVVGSTMAGEVDFPLMQRSGPEVCVLSTKAAIAQMVVYIRLALEVARLRGRLNDAAVDGYLAKLAAVPELIQLTLDERSGYLRNIAFRHHKVPNWFYLGRGLYYPIAMETALKMKEVTYLHVEGMSSGFLKHGTISLIDKGLNTIFLMPPKEDKDLFDYIMSSAQEVKARQGQVIGFHFEKEGIPLFDEQVILPGADPFTAPLLLLVAGQLMAYFSALALGRNIDKPRALAKSVTVG